MKNEPGDGPVRRRVLFVCIGNSCRSQLAEAFARHLAADVIEPASAGLNPLGHIAEATRAVGEEFGLTFEGQLSKACSASDIDWADLIVNLSGIPGPESFVTEKPVLDWNIDDPYGKTTEVYRRIAAEIEARVLLLTAELRAARASRAAK